MSHLSPNTFKEILNYWILTLPPISKFVHALSLFDLPKQINNSHEYKVEQKENLKR